MTSFSSDELHDETASQCGRLVLKRMWGGWGALCATSSDEGLPAPLGVLRTSSPCLYSRRAVRFCVVCAVVVAAVVIPSSAVCFTPSFSPLGSPSRYSMGLTGAWKLLMPVSPRHSVHLHAADVVHPLEVGTPPLLLWARADVEVRRVARPAHRVSCAPESATRNIAPT